MTRNQLGRWALAAMLLLYTATLLAWGLGAPQPVTLTLLAGMVGAGVAAVLL